MELILKKQLLMIKSINFIGLQIKWQKNIIVIYIIIKNNHLSQLFLKIENLIFSRKKDVLTISILLMYIKL